MKGARSVTLEEKALRSIGYDPIRRVFWIDKKFNNYKIEFSGYTQESVEEFVKNKFKTIRALKFADPQSRSRRPYHKDYSAKERSSKTQKSGQRSRRRSNKRKGDKRIEYKSSI